MATSSGTASGTTWVNPCTFAYDVLGKIWYGYEGATGDPAWPAELQLVTLDDTSTPSGQALFNNPVLYTLVSGTPVQVSNAADLLLAQAQAQQIASLQQAAQVAMGQGFTSNANGTSLVYGFQAQDQANLSQLAVMTALGTATWPVDWQLPNGSIVSLTQAQFMALLGDAQAFKWQVLDQTRQLAGQVLAAPTPGAVKQVGWPQQP